MPEIILIARSGRLGDMVMVAPAVRKILDRHPDADITLFTSTDGATLFRGFDRRIVQFYVNGKTPLTRRLKWIYFYFKLRKINFDSVYCLDDDWRIQSLLSSTTDRFHKAELTGSDTIVHAAVRALNVVGSPIKDVSEISIPFIPVSDIKTSLLDSYLGQLGIKKEDVLVGLNPSFSGLKRSKTRKYKLWSLKNWARLADKLYEYGVETKRPIRVVIYSLPKDKYLAEEISSLSEHAPIILAPNADLQFFEAYLSRLDLYIGPDTGGTHLAAGLGTDLIALYAITDPFDCGPVVPSIRDSVIRAKIKGDEENFLDLISTNDVFNLAVKKLEKDKTI